MTTERRVPLHLAVLVGASTAVYAASLAGVTALQSASNGSVVEAQAPARDAVERLSEGHDRLEAELDAAARVYAASADRYEQVTLGVSSLDRSLETFAAEAARVSGAARALPGRVTMPTVSRTTTSTSKPRVSGTTGASG